VAKIGGVKTLFCFGYGYCARVLAHRLIPRGWRIGGTFRDEAARVQLAEEGCAAFPFASRTEVSAALAGFDHILLSVPPSEDGDPVLGLYRDELIAQSGSLRWIGYLSTTGVYGDRGGAWVDETTPPAPTSERGRRRLAAERAWLGLHQEHGLPIHIFRLAGIYGPGRNQLVSLLRGKAARVVKPGHIFSRIHVADVAGVMESSLKRPIPGRVYNVCDDEPAAPQDVLSFAAELLRMPPPPEIPFDNAGLTDLSKSFYEESKRVSNRRIKEELGYRLTYPSYREGLLALNHVS
jgi:nucleoside-diphosphate-sugar epimerase